MRPHSALYTNGGFPVSIKPGQGFRIEVLLAVAVRGSLQPDKPMAIEKNNKYLKLLSVIAYFLNQFSKPALIFFEQLAQIYMRQNANIPN
jgi:hypothetical protein